MFVKKTFDSIVKRPLCYTLAGFLTAYFTFGFLRGSFKLYIAISLFAVLLSSAVFFALKRSINKDFLRRYIFPLLLIICATALGMLLSFINFDCRLNEINDKYIKEVLSTKQNVSCLVGG